MEVLIQQRLHIGPETLFFPCNYFVKCEGGASAENVANIFRVGHDLLMTKHNFQIGLQN